MQNTTMKSLIRFLLAASLLSIGLSTQLFAQCSPGGLVVLVNKDNPSDSLSMAQLRKLMLGDVRSWPNKKPVLVVRRESSSPVFQCVLSAIVRMTDAEFRRYQMNVEFRGEEAVPLKMAPSPATAEKIVTDSPGAITIVESSAVPAGGGPFKVVRINGKNARRSRLSALSRSATKRLNMKPTIRNKLIWGFAGVIVLMAAVAGVGANAVFSLRASAHEATRVGGQLNAVALEVQVHDLEAQRRVKNFIDQAPVIGVEQAKQTYLEEATFEINEMRGLAERAARIAPTEERRAKFTKILEGVNQYEAAIAKAVESVSKSPAEKTAAVDAYNEAADRLHDHSEDGEVAGREASQLSLEDIERTSKSSVTAVVVISMLGLILGVIVSITLSRAILNPVEHLKDVAENVSLGNLDIAVKRYSEDEIGDLGDSFSRMVTAVKFFRLEAEMTAADAAAEQSERGGQ